MIKVVKKVKLNIQEVSCSTDDDLTSHVNGDLIIFHAESKLYVQILEE